ncbi:hypothetical protein ACTQ9L_01270 [Deinococcus wulumuqiensis]
MTELPNGLSELVERARSLARPTWLLREAGEGPVMGIWGGEGVVARPTEESNSFSHWLSVRADLLPLEPALSGVVSLYFDEEDARGLVLHHPAATLSGADGEALYASARADLPHADALFEHLPPAQQEHLAQTFGGTPGVLRGQAFGFPHPLATALDNALVGEHPLWSDDPPAAQIGGWPWGWPDTAWNEREGQGQTLVLWTFRDSEPWLEVWWTGQQFEVAEHIT